MASTNAVLREQFPAGADLSARQYTFVKLNSSGQIVACVAGDPGHSLQNTPASGEAGTVDLVGISKVTLGANVNAGQPIASDINGKAIVAVTTNFINGEALATGVSGDVIPFLAAVPTSIKA